MTTMSVVCTHQNRTTEKCILLYIYRYTSPEIVAFMEECTVLDPRFKNYFGGEEVHDMNIFHRLTIILSGEKIKIKTEPVQPDDSGHSAPHVDAALVHVLPALPSLPTMPNDNPQMIPDRQGEFLFKLNLISSWC